MDLLIAKLEASTEQFDAILRDSSLLVYSSPVSASPVPPASVFAPVQTPMTTTPNPSMYGFGLWGSSPLCAIEACSPSEIGYGIPLSPPSLTGPVNLSGYEDISMALRL